ncbi:AbrB/MazE/SpoVT family DNA-binding domain-containing protein [Leptospira fletcheri]|uniref:AbrB/MazE/SpoVT family DNA-binding domain-containing protein n=1 Tax=Leptospira fletcheri TaxID=2484981 RepID=A0A4R9GBV6_9LEPT|nr:AbrB/MazE/SpoVT family DNA-binding domain-containing protein [Leptospira fletcheri]TGK08865.1 AbrB/MazE/SpoVT family DNA-binding domain-containing protein [Leptospira fletcheri]
MRASVIQIGNSKGIRIPKAILEECQIGEEVELKIDKGKIMIIPVKSKPRDGWEKRFKEMSSNNEDKLLVPDSLDLSGKDWEW